MPTREDALARSKLPLERLGTCARGCAAIGQYEHRREDGYGLHGEQRPGHRERERGRGGVHTYDNRGILQRSCPGRTRSPPRQAAFGCRISARRFDRPRELPVMS